MSCKRSGARPAGRQLLDGSTHTPGTWAAAAIPTWETQLYQPRALAENGRRLFFESFDPLVPTDTNGAQDVYEWEAPGEGGCEEASAAFDPKAGGCIALVSSGQSPAPSSFVDASADGADVFLTTAQSLVPWDPGQIDVYDARIGGGLPARQRAPKDARGKPARVPPPPRPPGLRPRPPTPARATSRRRRGAARRASAACAATAGPAPEPPAQAPEPWKASPPTPKAKPQEGSRMRTRTIMVLLTTGLSLLIAGTAAVASARAAFGLNGLSVAI